MRLTILGMNGPYPAPGGATSGYLLAAGESRIALDMGCGTLSRLTALTPPEELTALLLSHWHFDHSSDVLLLIYRLAACAKAPLHVYAPVDETSPVRKIVQGCTELVLHDIAPGDAFQVGDAQVTAFAARHPVPAGMYRVQAEGSTFCYTGDTNTTETLLPFAMGADFLLADGLFTEAAWTEGKPHLAAHHVAQLAKDAGVGQFVITHLNPTVDPQTLLKEARAIRIDAQLAACGNTYEI